MRDRKEGYQGLYADAHHNTTCMQDSGKSEIEGQIKHRKISWYLNSNTDLT